MAMTGIEGEVKAKDKIEEKQRLRELIWERLEEAGVARFPRPIRGRIPNFQGSEAAAERLRSLELWQGSRVVKVNPDSPQHPIRERAIQDGKVLYMPTPRLREGFIELRREFIPLGEERRATTIRHALRYGRRVRLQEMEPVDLIVLGAVAVSQDGGKLGKGGGYSDLEYAILRELNGSHLQVVTTVHPLQIVDQVPMEAHDVPVDYIITPREVIKIQGRYPKPRGILWELLEEEDLGRMPPLKELRALKESPSFKPRPS